MNNTDPTSFQSILAGVKRLRETESGGNNEQSKDISKTEVTAARSETIKSNEVTNAFNQRRQHAPPFNDNTGSAKSGGANFATALPGKQVLVNTTQKENPLLNHLKNTNWRYISSTKGTKLYYDYLIKKRSVLFLTLTYHKLYAEYINRRMLPLQSNGDNILIFVVDDGNSEDILKDIAKLCMFKGFTLLLAFNFEQAAKYIEYLNR
ncbi:hypothetical protein HG535_0C00400 [Zygotorulaspora mrakii]|uniref:ERCC1-like central domain-containing protein n=1 Tax=Zygotorulaspora mrakii TaxID=42260 RepID=A0A7H9AZD7_ZYGMR|nr:uncharacterized protein HG535_0C00400 [Zygotorulaspora mrakii]QLG71691.1 hypothetical protein HG535_0C00400 [Zygotorulaspora mrakii]